MNRAIQIEEPEIEAILPARDSSSISPTILPKVLRYIGATTLGLSALSFAVRRAFEQDSIERFYSFLAFTALLAACGFLCGLRYKEDKGARTFLGVSLAFLPPLFLQLGGLVYFLVAGIPLGIPEMFILHAPNWGTVGLALGIAIPLTLLIAFGGFSALARPRAKVLTLFFAAGLGALLAPTRVVDVVALLVLVSGVMMFAFTSLIGRKDAVFRTFEGQSAMALAALPVVLLCGRTLFLYGPTPLFGSALFVICGTFLWTFGRRIESGRASIAQILGLSLYAVAWGCFCNAVTTDPAGLLFSSVLADSRSLIMLPMLCLPIASGLVFASRELGEDQDSTLRLAGGIAAYPMVYHVAVTDHVGIAVTALFIAAGLVSAGLLRKDKSILTSGGILILTVLATNVHYAVDLYRMNPWLTLGVCGGAILLCSSYVERNIGTIVARVERARHELGNWS